jgi:hypothetical protein
VNDLTLICETCHCPIASNAGSIYAIYREINSACADEAEWQEHHPPGTMIDLGGLLASPLDLIHWHVRHNSCSSEHADEEVYEISAERISAWPQLAHWTAHLMGKTWFPLSDWDDLLRELSGEAPARRIRAVAREHA